MKYPWVLVLCSLILAAGFVLGMGRYHIISASPYVQFKMDKWTGRTEYTNSAMDANEPRVARFWVPIEHNPE
jgi:hypothetical protein